VGPVSVEPEVESLLYAPSSKAVPTQVPHRVTANPANSSNRTGLKRSGASTPGNAGANMMAAICCQGARPCCSNVTRAIKERPWALHAILLVARCCAVCDVMQHTPWAEAAAFRACGLTCL
jgi:hypothetical protein